MKYYYLLGTNNVIEKITQKDYVWYKTNYPKTKIYHSIHKAKYIKLLNDLEKETYHKRVNKLKQKINSILSEYPELSVLYEK